MIIYCAGQLVKTKLYLAYEPCGGCCYLEKNVPYQLPYPKWMTSPAVGLFLKPADCCKIFQCLSYSYKIMGHMTNRLTAKVYFCMKACLLGITEEPA